MSAIPYRSIVGCVWLAKLDAERADGTVDITVDGLSITKIPVFCGDKAKWPKGHAYRSPEQSNVEQNHAEERTQCQHG